MENEDVELLKNIRNKKVPLVEIVTIPQFFHVVPVDGILNSSLIVVTAQRMNVTLEEFINNNSGCKIYIYTDEDDNPYWKGLSTYSQTDFSPIKNEYLRAKAIPLTAEGIEYEMNKIDGVVDTTKSLPTTEGVINVGDLYSDEDGCVRVKLKGRRRLLLTNLR